MKKLGLLQLIIEEVLVPKLVITHSAVGAAVISGVKEHVRIIVIRPENVGEFFLGCPRHDLGSGFRLKGQFEFDTFV